MAAAGPSPGGGPSALRLLAPDTIVRPPWEVPGAVRAGLAAAPGEAALRLGLRRIPLGHPLGQGVPKEATGAETRVGPGAAAPILLLTTTLLRERVRRWGVPPGDTARFLPPGAAPRPGVVAEAVAPGGGEGGGAGEALPRFVTDYADLALNVRSRMEVGGDWSRFRPCDRQFRESCNPTLIPRLRPDMRFGVQVAGTIADRIRVDVDFDQNREFDAANRINIFYEGAEDDILRRLEVGDVTFRLPSSRFLTEGIPAGNFGFQAEGQLGPLDFQTVWAQQRGDLNSREFRLSGIGDQRMFVQEDTLELDDADFVRGQFFFLVDPRAIAGYPHIDVLDLEVGSAAPAVEPGPQPIQLYRYENDAQLRQQVEGFIQADAVAEADGERVVESGWFRYLQPGVDYFVHPSGLWIALRNPLRREEMLAVTYITAAGDTVGDYNPERIHNAGRRPRLRLLKASGGNHQPGRPTWDLEMHQVYRVSGSGDVEQSSVEMVISLGERSAGRTFKRTPAGEVLTFLQLFGVDQESPLDALDPAYVYSPGADFFQDQTPVRGTFIIFPTLRPFAAPPPLPEYGLTAEEAAEILADDANRRIYEEEDPFERDNAGRFRLAISYRLMSRGVISSFSLGALGIRDGSERIWLGDRLLVRGVDYEIDYDVGQVTLPQAEALFTAVPDATIRATWEQRSLFQVSPTQVFGLRTHTDIGTAGGLDVLTLYRSERTVATRPQLGTEPAAALLGGVSGFVESGALWVDRILSAIPGLRYDGRARFSLDGEVALSLPNPNTRGTVFVDDFDGSNAIPISLQSKDWVRGSAPARRDGVEAVLPVTLDETSLVPLVWQHQWIVESGVGDSVGVHEGFFPRQDIDHQIRVAGSETREPGLLLSFGGDRPVNRQAWASITTALSTTGMDLTKTDFLEFYAAGGEDLTLVLDLGVVSEDAFFADSLGNTRGVRADGGVPWGLGFLDQEADPARGEVWSTELDLRGVWPETCLAEPGLLYPIADPRAVCTRGNGRLDSEDLDGDGNLDRQERHLRYIIRLDGASPFLARTREETGTDFQLYRVPIRGPGTLEVGGAFSDADLRLVKHLRMTLAGSGNRRVRVARMRLVGSRWIRRGGAGVLEGIVGDTLAALGRVDVGTVSRVTEGEAYVSPPGVLEELRDPTSAFVGQGIEFNEKSLGITFEDIPAAGRAEVYQRFPQRPRNFLAYRQARMWVVARSGDFGPDRPHYFFFKVGTDAENFYIFRAPLSPPASPTGVTPGDWLPEAVVDFDVWLELRRRAEEELLLNPRGPGDPPVTVWASDSTYAVVLRDRGRAPDLANVREISLGIWNQGDGFLSGEVWVDELRLGRPVRDGGMAGSVTAEFDAAGVLATRLSYTNRGAFFRQLRDEPTYQNDRTLTLASTLRLDRFTPAEWGIDLPLTLNVDRLGRAPTFLANSDVRADRLKGLRPTESRQTRVGLAFRKRTPSVNPWTGFLLDGLGARVSYIASRNSAVTALNRSRGVNAGLDWSRDPGERSLPLVPGFVRGAVRALLPGFLEDGVTGARLRWTPEHISFGSSYRQRDTKIFRYDRIIELPEDSLVTPTLAPRRTLETVADVRFRPLPPLSAGVTFRSIRDLLSPEEAVSDPAVQTLLRRERSSLRGMDLGWETGRNLRTRLGFRPRVFSWLQSDFQWTTVYESERNARFVERRAAGSDTLLDLTRNARGQRNWRALFGLRPRTLAESLLGPRREGEDPGVTQLRGMIAALRPMRISYASGISARFNRDPVSPGTRFQWGLGDANDYRFLGRDTAATLVDQDTWTVSSGVRLPGGLGVDVGFRETTGTTLDTRSDRSLFQRRWPDVRAALPPIAPPAFLRIQQVAVSSGYSREVREIRFGEGGAQERTRSEVQVPVEVSLTWLGAVVTTYRGTLRRGEAVDPTGTTEHRQESHRISINSNLRPPDFIARRLDRPVRVSILGSFTSEEDCRSTAARPECVAFLDQIRRSVSLAMDTSVGGFEVGMQMSYDDRQSFVGLRTGSTQFRVGLYGQLQFSAGVLPSQPFISGS